MKPQHYAVYHWDGRAAALFGPVLVIVLAVWAALIVLLLSARRPGRWRIAVWAGLVLLIPWIVVRCWMLQWRDLIPPWAYALWFLATVACWVLAVVLWTPARSKRYEVEIQFAATVLGFVAISGVLFFAQFGWCWWQARSLNDPRPLHAQSGPQSKAPSPRVLWVVLDELSFQEVYEHRYPGLQLPALDALAAQSTVFTEVVPAGFRTEQVLPDLISGRAGSEPHFSATGEIRLRNPATGKWKLVDPQNTVFADALKLGYRTALVGWYNPYCRVYPAVLDECRWVDVKETADGMISDGTFRSNLELFLSSIAGPQMFHRIVRRVIQHQHGDPQQLEQRAALHIEDYNHLYAAADSVLLDRSMSFALLHLPIPHPGGIYDRATGQLTTKPSSYIDNLALTDRYIAHLRSVLEQTGQWNSTVLVIMGDHSWRTARLWRTDAMWTAEDERASHGGQFDPRPVYIVKLANQQKGTRIALPFQAIETRRLLDALLAHEIRTPEDLQAWVAGPVQPVK
jgi:hypothetical protein